MEKKKLYDIILYICNEIPPFKNGALKINKLVWFIESEYYRKHNTTITGVKFAAIDNGPVINDYKEYFKAMHQEKLVKINKDDHNNWHFTPLRDSVLATLDDNQKLIVTEMVGKLKELSAEALRDLSHKDAYEITLAEANNVMGEIIDMDLVLLESTPLSNSQEEEKPDLQETKRIIEKHNIETV